MKYIDGQQYYLCFYHFIQGLPLTSFFNLVILLSADSHRVKGIWSSEDAEVV